MNLFYIPGTWIAGVSAEVVETVSVKKKELPESILENPSSELIQLIKHTTEICVFAINCCYLTKIDFAFIVRDFSINFERQRFLREPGNPMVTVTLVIWDCPAFTSQERKIYTFTDKLNTK